MNKLRLGSLFSGIGGIELGLERTGGFETVFQVEQDDFCQRVLAKHWPDVPRFNDVREVGAHNLPACDFLAGGFPCPDVSVAGERAGIEEGTRSGLWIEFARIIREIRPGGVLLENVTGLLSLGMGIVLGDLAALGYDAEWRVLSARQFGAPHLRERVFVFAYPSSAGWEGLIPHDGILGGAGPAHTIAMHRAATPWMDVDADRARLRGSDGLSVTLERRRLQQFGNAVVPQVAEHVGHRILAFYNSIQAVA